MKYNSMKEDSKEKTKKENRDFERGDAGVDLHVGTDVQFETKTVVEKKGKVDSSVLKEIEQKQFLLNRIRIFLNIGKMIIGGSDANVRLQHLNSELANAMLLLFKVNTIYVKEDPVLSEEEFGKKGLDDRISLAEAYIKALESYKEKALLELQNIQIELYGAKQDVRNLKSFNMVCDELLNQREKMIEYANDQLGIAKPENFDTKSEVEKPDIVSEVIKKVQDFDRSFKKAMIDLGKELSKFKEFHGFKISKKLSDEKIQKLSKKDAGKEANKLMLEARGIIEKTNATSNFEKKEVEVKKGEGKKTPKDYLELMKECKKQLEEHFGKVKKTQEDFVKEKEIEKHNKILLSLNQTPHGKDCELITYGDWFMAYDKIMTVTCRQDLNRAEFDNLNETAKFIFNRFFIVPGCSQKTTISTTTQAIQLFFKHNIDALIQKTEGEHFKAPQQVTTVSIGSTANSTISEHTEHRFICDLLNDYFLLNRLGMQKETKFQEFEQKLMIYINKRASALVESLSKIEISDEKQISSEDQKIFLDGVRFLAIIKEAAGKYGDRFSQYSESIIAVRLALYKKLVDISDTICKRMKKQGYKVCEEFVNQIVAFGSETRFDGKDGAFWGLDDCIGPVCMQFMTLKEKQDNVEKELPQFEVKAKNLIEKYGNVDVAKDVPVGIVMEEKANDGTHQKKDEKKEVNHYDLLKPSPSDVVIVREMETLNKSIGIFINSNKDYVPESQTLKLFVVEKSLQDSISKHNEQYAKFLEEEKQILSLNDAVTNLSSECDALTKRIMSLNVVDCRKTIPVEKKEEKEEKKNESLEVFDSKKEEIALLQALQSVKREVVLEISKLSENVKSVEKRAAQYKNGDLNSRLMSLDLIIDDLEKVLLEERIKMIENRIKNPDGADKQGVEIELKNLMSEKDLRNYLNGTFNTFSLFSFMQPRTPNAEERKALMLKMLHENFKTALRVTDNSVPQIGDPEHETRNPLKQVNVLIEGKYKCGTSGFDEVTGLTFTKLDEKGARVAYGSAQDFMEGKPKQKVELKNGEVVTEQQTVVDKCPSHQ